MNTHHLHQWARIYRAACQAGCEAEVALKLAEPAETKSTDSMRQLLSQFETAQASTLLDWNTSLVEGALAEA